MFGSGNIRGKSPSWFLKILKFSSFYSGNFKIFKNALGQFVRNRSPKHVITNTNCYEKHRLCQISSEAFFISIEFETQVSIRTYSSLWSIVSSQVATLLFTKSVFF